MKNVLHHILSILLLPVMAAVAVPYWLLTSKAGFGLDGHRLPAEWLFRSAGSLFFAAGFVLFAWCVRLFAHEGRGTLAPWDPTKRLVAIGPYRHVRNPMISGVAMMLLGESLFWHSRNVGLWFCLFLCINHLYFLLSEEPGLERRFGAVYRRYQEHVPRWIPRLHPWNDSDNDRGGKGKPGD